MATKSLEWEQFALGPRGGHEKMYRTPVPGGWLVMVAHPEDPNIPPALAMSFVPDPEHAWAPGEA